MSEPDLTALHRHLVKLWRSRAVQREDKMRVASIGLIIMMSVLAGVLLLPEPQTNKNTKLFLPGTDLISAGAGFAAGVAATSLISGAISSSNNNGG